MANVKLLHLWIGNVIESNRKNQCEQKVPFSGFNIKDVLGTKIAESQQVLKLLIQS